MEGEQEKEREKKRIDKNTRRIELRVIVNSGTILIKAIHASFVCKYVDVLKNVDKSDVCNV